MALTVDIIYDDSDVQILYENGKRTLCKTFNFDEHIFSFLFNLS